MTDLRVQTLVGVADPERPGFVLKPNQDGSINIQGNVTVEVGNVTIGGVFIEDEATGHTATVSAAGLLAVDGSGVTQPISASALPLPALASTSTNQTTAIAALGTINTSIGLQAKLSDTQPVSLASIPNGNTTLLASSAVIGHVVVDSGSISGAVTVTSGNIAVSNFPASQAVTVTSGNVAISNSPAVTVTSGNITATVASTTITGNVAVTGTFWQSTQPVSDTNLELAQGTAGATATGPMVQGLVSDSEPSYLNTTVQPLSLTGIGRLRVAIDEAEVEFFSTEGQMFWVKPAWQTASPWGSGV